MKQRSSFVLSFILGIVLFGSSFFLWKKYTHQKILHRLSDPRFFITQIIQTAPQKEALKTTYLAELLHLSKDKPTPIDLFSIQEGEKALLSSPLIKRAKISKRPPNGLYIEYALREPIYRLVDFMNTAIDEEGFFFPLTPFFSPKNLPELYLGTEVPLISPEKKKLAFDLLAYFACLRQPSFRLQRVDLAASDHPSLGRREIVIILQLKQGETHTLRLSPLTLYEGLGNYQSLEGKLQGKSQIIDLRLGHVGFIQPVLN